MFQSPTKMYQKCKALKRRHLQLAGLLVQQRNISQQPSEPLIIAPKPFRSIPGPKVLPLVGSVYNYLPLVGKYYNRPLHESGVLKYRQYGKLVLETILPSKTVLWVFDPKDMETLFMNELRSPERRSHLAFKKYREDRPDIYNDGGLLPTNGDEWWRLRRSFQKGLSDLPHIRSYLPVSDEIIMKFVRGDLRDAVMSNPEQDFLPLVSRLFLQLIGIVAFDVDLDCFSREEKKPDSKSSRLLQAIEIANSLILALDDSEESWTKKETVQYRQFAEAVSIMEEVAVELVKRKNEILKSNLLERSVKKAEISSLLEMYLASDELDTKDVVGMALDFFLAGIDTTAYTASYALYHLSTNQRVQFNILQEACRVLGPVGSENPITAEVLSRIPYTRAVLREVLRMSPISVGVGRVTTCEMVLSGHEIPIQTQVVTQNQVACRLEQHFRYANRFVPERWLKGHPLQSSCSPYVSLPFGHGLRSCIARRLAEQQLLTLILRFVHNFNISWGRKVPLRVSKKISHINKPDGPVVFSYIYRAR